MSPSAAAGRASAPPTIQQRSVFIRAPLFNGQTVARPPVPVNWIRRLTSRFWSGSGGKSHRPLRDSPDSPDTAVSSIVQESWRHRETRFGRDGRRPFHSLLRRRSLRPVYDRTRGRAFGPDAARLGGACVARSLRIWEVERETGIEPATNGLEGRDSTTELLPRGGGGWIRTTVGLSPADLQSAAFGHSATPPLRMNPPSARPSDMEPALGFEPRTCCLQGSCSTPELRRQRGPRWTSRPGEGRSLSAGALRDKAPLGALSAPRRPDSPPPAAGALPRRAAPRRRWRG